MPAGAEHAVDTGKANFPHCREIIGMVGGAGGVLGVSEGPVWINIKDGPMGVHGKVLNTEILSVRTHWGH